MPIELLELPMPVTLRSESPISDEDLMQFSERNRPWRIERNKAGEITIMTPVGGTGSTHERYVTRMLGNWTEDDGRGIDFSPSVGFKLPDGSCLSPDASWISLERWNTLTPEQQDSFPPLCPDFVIEVRSKSDKRKIVQAKMQTWIDNGCKLAWLVDPIDCNVSIYRPGQAPEFLDKPEVVSGNDPVAGFELRCGPLWLQPRNG
jgi:Uma2 family endonuclease